MVIKYIIQENNMKIKKIIISVIIIMNIVLIKNICYAAVAVNGGDIYVNTTANNSFEECYNMRNGGTSTLGEGSNLDIHMTLNSDWGAVAYLSDSKYGGMTGDSLTSITISSINGPESLTESKTFYTTTGNATGVMDFGTWPTNTYYGATQTASILSSYSATTGNLSTLVQYKNTKYVESLSTEGSSDSSNLGKALGEITCGAHGGNSGGSFYNQYATSSYPMIVRLNGAFSNRNQNLGGNGVSRSDTTFRPVIWNY